MIISDVLYGEFEVDQVVEELISSKSMQRLKGIHQNGSTTTDGHQKDLAGRMDMALSR